MLEEEQEKCLKKFETGFNAWLRGVSQVQLEKAVQTLLRGQHNEKP